MFLTKYRAEADDRSPWGSFWFEPVSVRTAAGARVSPDAAMRLTAVYACVRLLAETMACLPFCMYRKDSQGNRTEVTDHWLHRLIARRPNDWQTPFEWREMMQGHLALRGNAYNRIVANNKGEITDLVPLHPDRVRVELLDNGSYRYQVMQRSGQLEPVPRGEIWQLRGLSSDGLMGLNPIEIARESLGVALATRAYSARFFNNDARPLGGWLEYPGTFGDKDKRKAFSDSWQTGQGGENLGKTAVLEGGIKYHELGVSNKDSQFLELTQAQVTDIARMFRCPPHLIGDLSRATFSNIEQQSLEFVKFTMTPWAERWESSIETFLMLDSDEDLDVEFDFDNLERGDMKTRAEFYGASILDGWGTRNEARKAEKRNPIDGLDEPLVPLNMVEEGEQPDGNAGAAGPDDPDRLDELTNAVAARVVRKEIAAVGKAFERSARDATDVRLENWLGWIDVFYADHIAYVQESLACSAQLAQRWCEMRRAELQEVSAGEWLLGRDSMAALLSAWDEGGGRELAALVRADVCKPRNARRRRRT